MSGPGSFDEDSSSQSTPTPAQQPSLHRDYSVRSVTDQPQHHYQGTPYFSRPVSPSVTRQPHPILLRNSTARRVHRSTSLSSSTATNRGRRETDGVLSEEDEDSSDELTPQRLRGRSAAIDEELDGLESDAENEGEEDREEDPITLKDRQSLINVEHPFGLRIWKPALYKKSRSVTRHADEALHSIPSAQAERHLLPGNIFWALLFGWWLALACIAVSIPLYLIPQGGQRYSSLLFGLGRYLLWPFGKYVKGDLEHEIGGDSNDEENERMAFSPGLESRSTQDGPVQPNGQYRGQSANDTIRGASSNGVTNQHVQNVSWDSNPANESSSLLPFSSNVNKSYRSIRFSRGSQSSPESRSSGSEWLGKACFWLAFATIVAPLMLFVCLMCWALVVTIPMAKLNWALIKYLFQRPSTIQFCTAPPAVVVSNAPEPEEDNVNIRTPMFSVKHARLAAGQVAPSGSPNSTVLLCTYRAIGLKYYKYTIGGVNILFVNLIPIVFFVIFDGWVILPIIERLEHEHRHIPALLGAIGSRSVIFFLSLLSVIPLSYFIGMAVASISAQSSIGMGAVINATFGSIIEILLYGIALTQGKGRLVEGSIVGSLLAGVLLMPGMSMCSSAIRRKEQKFNAKSAGVTSMMLIMAIIGTLAPTLFYQTYGNFQLVCEGCPRGIPPTPDTTWRCDRCIYKHPDPATDPFYQSTVKSLMYFCTSILLFSYLIGLWFSLRTHASQIWQNPQQLLHPMELPVHNRLSLYHKLLPGATQRAVHLSRKPSSADALGADGPSGSQTPGPRLGENSLALGQGTKVPLSPTAARRVSYTTSAMGPHPPFTPMLESVDHAVQDQSLQLPGTYTTEDFTRAVAVATVSALHHQQTRLPSPSRLRASGQLEEGGGHSAEHGGHDAPSWSRLTSASVLLGCTALYAIIAELLVDVVDVVLEGSGIDEKFLGVTLFALVPNTTEFMNAISFALNGNIALSMEIGSAYALQVCLLQIPAMVAFSAYYDPGAMGELSDTFTLIFPRWDVIVIILSMFLMTYTYIEAKSNYHRGSILILSYLVLTAGFYFAPLTDIDVEHIRVDLRELPVVNRFWLWS